MNMLKIKFLCFFDSFIDNRSYSKSLYKKPIASIFYVSLYSLELLRMFQHSFILEKQNKISVVSFKIIFLELYFSNLLNNIFVLLRCLTNSSSKFCISVIKPSVVQETTRPPKLFILCIHSLNKPRIKAVIQDPIRTFDNSLASMVTKLPVFIS